jgi:hypothetical protein
MLALVLLRATRGKRLQGPETARRGWRGSPRRNEINLRPALRHVKSLLVLCVLLVLCLLVVSLFVSMSSFLCDGRLQLLSALVQNTVVLTKYRREDGGLDAEAALVGPAVFLDIWAVRDLCGSDLTDLRSRFSTPTASSGPTANCPFATSSVFG